MPSTANSTIGTTGGMGDTRAREGCERSLTRLRSDSNVFNEEEESSIVEIRKDDIEKGEILGTGGFSHVQAIAMSRRTSLFFNTDINQTLKERRLGHEKSTGQTTVLAGEDEDLDTSLASYVSKIKMENYAVKSIRSSIDPERRYNGAIDLAKEAKFLQALSHEHIIGIHSQSDNPGSEDYFIIIERLEICLSKQIKIVWPQDIIALKNSGKSGDELKNGLLLMMNERLAIAQQVSSGLAYMHEKNIVFRDMKPDNVGLTAAGVAKIFDFGLAKELKTRDKIGKNQYIATQSTGTRRYMSHEVYFGKPYGLPADVYSFTLLLWETASLSIPYSGMSSSDHTWKVYKLRKRPKIHSDWPKPLKRWTKKGWSHNPQSRLKMKIISKEMDSYLKESCL